MIYTIFYRNSKTGGRAQLELEVVDKASVWKELQDRNISAISIVEGKVISKPNTAKRNIIIGISALFVIVGILALLFSSRTGDDRDIFDQEREKRIAEVTPKVNNKQPNVDSKQLQDDVKVEMSQRKPTRKELRDIANGRGTFTPPAYTSQVSTVEREVTLFAHPLEHWLARFMTIEPGEEILGEPEYIFNERFRSKIASALVSKIEFTEDDDDSDRALKQSVIDAKNELRQYIIEGEDPCNILIATYKELQNLGLYKKDIEDEVKRVVKDGEATDEDCEIILEAANKMLQERGCGEIKMPSIFKRRFRTMSTKGKTK